MVPDADPGRAPIAPAPAWLRVLVVWMDEAIPIPGTSMRLGLDPILGLLAPAVGDGISAATHLALLVSGFRNRVPRATLVRMAINALVDAAIGTIPLAGDVFDVGFKANRRNLDLLERMHRRGKPTASIGDYAFLAGVFSLVGLALLLPILVAGTVLALGLRWLG